MRFAVRSRIALSVTILAALLASGCNDGKVKVKGSVVKDGKPLLPGKNQSIHVVFHRLNADGSEADSAPAMYLRDQGTFEVIGADGKGIPKGKYRISVRQIQGESNDLLKGAFGTTNSPIVREIKDSSEIKVDLSRPEG